MHQTLSLIEYSCHRLDRDVSVASLTYLAPRYAVNYPKVCSEKDGRLSRGLKWCRFKIGPHIRLRTRRFEQLVGPLINVD